MLYNVRCTVYARYSRYSTLCMSSTSEHLIASSPHWYHSPLYYLNLLAHYSACTSCTLLYLYLLQLVLLVTRALPVQNLYMSPHPHAAQNRSDQVQNCKLLLQIFTACLPKYFIFWNITGTFLIYFKFLFHSIVLFALVQLNSYLLLCSTTLQSTCSYWLYPTAPCLLSSTQLLVFRLRPRNLLIH